MTQTSTPNVQPSAVKERLYSLDMLRGLDMLLLVVIGPIVRAADSAWHFSPAFMGQFRHGWECFTLWDIIMPLFIFMCGAAIPLTGLICLAQFRKVRGKECLVWYFNEKGQPVLPS